MRLDAKQFVFVQIKYILNERFCTRIRFETEAQPNGSELAKWLALLTGQLGLGLGWCVSLFLGPQRVRPNIGYIARCAWCFSPFGLK